MAPHILIFGDQTTSVYEGLQALLYIPENSILTSFLHNSFEAIQRERIKLPPLDAETVPQTETLGLMLEALKKENSKPTAAINSALCCIYQVGYYIYLLSLGKVRFPHEDTTFVSFCSGSFASAAINCSQSIFDIPHLGTQATIVAFYTGLYVQRRAAVLSIDALGNTSSWSAVVSVNDEQEAISAVTNFYQSRSIPSSMRPYISAISHNTATISGPPKLLDQLLQVSPLKDKKFFRAPIYGPYHAPAIYSDDEVKQLISSSLGDEILFQERVAQSPEVSCSTGLRSSGQQTFGELLRISVGDILTKQVRIEAVSASLEKLASNSTSMTITPLGSPYANTLAGSLSRKGLTVKLNVVKAPQTSGTDSSSQNPTSESLESSKIAIIGFSGRFPDADSLDEFWSLLQAGLDVHRPVPADRFDWKAHQDLTRQTKNSSRIRDGCWIKSPGLFDPKFFHMSPKEACQTDPAQRLALLTAYEALEMAGFVPDRTASSQRHRVGVFYGTTSDDWREVNSGQNVDTYFIPGGNRAFVPGKINYFFKFSGPSVSVDTACSSSLAAINIAATALLNRECDTAVAGGTNIMTNPDNFAGLDRGHFLCPEGNCKTFDDGADGYCRADGVGTVILKRLSDAVLDKDPIFGVILGTHTNHSAEAVSITRPLADAQEYLFKKILNESGVRPHDINYIEMHGTGTQAGDAVEMKSVLNTFAWDHSRTTNLFLGSVKSNVGHGESASGVIALIKVLLMMQKNKIPPHCGIKTKINHGFPLDLEKRGIRIPLNREFDWVSPAGGDGKRRAFVNNFSAAGGNTALLIEDALRPDAATETLQDLRVSHVITLSARSIKSLKQNMLNLAEFIDNASTDITLSQLAYTTAARRNHHSLRVALVANSLPHLKNLLLDEIESVNTKRPVPKSRGTCFLFSGQGSQYTAMGRSLYTRFSSFARDVDDFDALARGQGFPSILPLITGAEEIEKLSPTVIQLGTCILQMAMARLWISLGLKPQCVAGHSLGEYAAMNIAGVLSIHDTIHLCGSRATLLEKRCTPDTHGMIAVKASEIQLRATIEKSNTEIACYNSPTDIVISGPNSALDVAAADLDTLGYKYSKLVLPYAFHSSQVDPMMKELDELALAVEFHPPTIPIVSTLLASVVQAGEAGVFGPSYISRHCREPVNFDGAIMAAHSHQLLNSNYSYLEIGAHPTLTRLLKAIRGVDTSCHPTMRRDQDAFKTLSDTLAALHLEGLSVSWDSFHKDFSACQKVIDIPRYSWDLDNYWIQYQHNWCLTKGNPPLALEAPEAVIPIVKAVRLSSSVHAVLEQATNEETASILIQSDIHDAELRLVAEGHLVNGTVLIPSGLYADVAYTLTQHLLCVQYPQGTSLVPDICDMVVDKALIMKKSLDSQLFRAALTIDWSASKGSMDLYSVDASGKRTTSHAKCAIHIQDPTVWSEEWQRNLHFVERSIKGLYQGVDQGIAHKIGRGLAYKLFTAVVEYSSTYQGINHVIFNSEDLEATAQVQLQPVTGNYKLNPFWADSLGHISGFIMHASDVLDHTEYVFINHGWKYMRLTKPYSPDGLYRTYVRMQPIKDDNSVYSGDVYMLHDGKIVASYGGVTFSKVSRKILNMVLGGSNSQPSRAPAKANVPPQQTHTSTQRTVKSSGTTPAPPPKQRVSNGVLGQVLQIIADEAGVDSALLTSTTVFNDFGVDSLLSLNIISRLREDLGLDIPSTFFEDYPSVSEVSDFLGSISPASTESETTTVSSSRASPYTSATTTDLDYQDLGETKPMGVEASIGILLELLAEEVGTTAKELSKVDSLAEVGVDSLVALTFASRVREELDIELPHDIFLEYTQLDDVIAALRKILKPKTNGIPPAPTTPAPLTTVMKHPPATSSLLQGGKDSLKTLFMFPDGSGSSTSYMTLPTILSGLRVYGLNCPYLKRPEDLQCSLQDLTAPYVAEIRRRQPKGPYSLAGWSAGGIAAYDAAQELVNQGDVVEKLILLDSPNPIGLGKLPPRFYKFLETKGVFGLPGGQSPPAWLIQHFLSFIDALDKYRPKPFYPAHAAPKVTIIWATDGVCKNSSDERPVPHPDDTKEMKWLLENRVDLGPNGWDTLVSRENIVIECLDGANHFSMMKAPMTERLAALMTAALEKK